MRNRILPSLWYTFRKMLSLGYKLPKQCVILNVRYINFLSYFPNSYNEILYIVIKISWCSQKHSYCKEAIYLFTILNAFLNYTLFSDFKCDKHDNDLNSDEIDRIFSKNFEKGHC